MTKELLSELSEEELFRQLAVHQKAASLCIEVLRDKNVDWEAWAEHRYTNLAVSGYAKKFNCSHDTARNAVKVFKEKLSASKLATEAILRKVKL